MTNEAVIHDPLHAMLAGLIVDTLGLDPSRLCELTPHGPLIGGAPGLTMLDLHEVAARVAELFDVSFNDGVSSRVAFKSIASLASFIRKQAPVRIVASLPALEPEFDRTELIPQDGRCVLEGLHSGGFHPMPRFRTL